MTDTEEIVGIVVVPVLPTEPPPQPAISSKNDAANNNPRRSFKYCLQNMFPAQRLYAVRCRQTHGPQASTSLCDALSRDWATCLSTEVIENDNLLAADASDPTYIVRLLLLNDKETKGLRTSLDNKGRFLIPDGSRGIV